MLVNPPEIKKPVDAALREKLVQLGEAEGNSKGLAKIAFLYLFMALNLDKY